MMRRTAVVFSVVVLALLGGLRPASGLLHILGGGVVTGGAGSITPDATTNSLGWHTATVSFEAVGAAWHLVLADVVQWECVFEMATHPAVPESLALGLGTSAGECLGHPQTAVPVVSGPGPIRITCPLVASGYARVGGVLQIAGVCLSNWNGIADISDVTITLALKGAEVDRLGSFEVSHGAFRYRG